MTLSNAKAGMLTTLAVLMLSGCATKTVVVPKAGHNHHAHVKHHVVYYSKPARRHCWRHRGHWDCR